MQTISEWDSNKVCHFKYLEVSGKSFFLFKQVPFGNNKPKSQNDFVREVIIKAN